MIIAQTKTVSKAHTQTTCPAYARLHWLQRASLLSGAALALLIGAAGEAARAQSLVEGTAYGPNSLALGAGSVAGVTGRVANSATAIGVLSEATGAGATASGSLSQALAGGSTATGFRSIADQDNATANGISSTALGQQSTAIGASSKAWGSQSTATGATADASAAGASAFGANSSASGVNSTALGLAAQASTDNSVALGASSTTGAAIAVTNGSVGGRTYAYAGGSPVGVVSVGASGAVRQIQNVAAGRIAADSTDAVNGSQLYASYQAINAAMGQSVGGLAQAVDALTTIVNQLDARQAAAQKEARAGIAAAVALVNAPMPSAPGKTSWAGNVARFRDQTAMGFSLAHRLDTNKPLAMTAGLSFTPGTGDKVGRIGMAGEF